MKFPDYPRIFWLLKHVETKIELKIFPQFLENCKKKFHNSTKEFVNFRTFKDFAGPVAILV